MKNKGLLILFGLWRNFDNVVYQVKDQFEGFDIVVATWDNDIGDLDNFSVVNTKRVYKALGKIKKVIIRSYEKESITYWNTANMVSHWKEAINSIEDENQYDIVVLQRFDLLINTKTILNYELEDNSVYVEGNNTWMNDWVFVANFNTMKRFINSFPNDYVETFGNIPNIGRNPHVAQGYILEKYNFKTVDNSYFKKLWYILFKNHGNGNEYYWRHFNEMGIKFFELDKKSKQLKLFLDSIYTHGKTKGNKEYYNI